MDEFSLDNLRTYLTEKNFNITSIYSVDNYCCFIRVLCINTGDDIVISIPSKYRMTSDKSIELIKFTDTDIEDGLLKGNIIGEYNQIDIKGMEDDNLYLDPSDADKLLEQYQSIDIDHENAIILRENIVLIKQQLDRLKLCTNKIKYKLCIITPSIFCTITRSNDIDCFVVKRGKQTKTDQRELCVIIDLESFYDKIDSIHSDINRVYKNLYTIMGKAHRQQTSIITSRLNQYIDISKKLTSKYTKKEKYESVIRSLNDTLIKINRQEKDLIKQIKGINKDGPLSEATSISFLSKKLDDDYKKLLVFKEDSIKLLSDIKSDYNNFVLDFDYALFDNNRLLHRVSTNFSKIGVIKDCKK